MKITREMYHLNYQIIVQARGVVVGDIVYSNEWEEFKVIEERERGCVFVKAYDENDNVIRVGVWPITRFTYKVKAIFHV